MAAGFAALAACADHPGPVLSSVSPGSAAAGAVVTLTGQRMCGPTGDCATAGGQIQIGLTLPAVEAQIEMFSDSSAQISIPSLARAGDTQLVLVVDDQSSNALAFTVLP